MGKRTFGVMVGLLATMVGLLALLPQPQSLERVAFAQQGAITKKLPELALRVEDFGAVGDGVRNDAPAIQRAIDEAAVGCRCVQFTPGKTYRLNSGLAVTTDNMVINAYGAQFMVNFAGVGITLGRPDDAELTTRFIQWRGGRILKGASSSTPDFTSGNVGMRLLNLSHSSIYDFKIFGFEKGLELLGDGEGTQYNTIIPAEIGYCKFGVALIARNSGWANANCFLGSARIGFYQGQPDSTGGYAIYMNREATSVNTINQNTFEALSLENAMSANKPAGAVYMNCTDCAFRGLRYEGFDHPSVITGPDFASNTVDGGAELSDKSIDLDLTLAPSPTTVFFKGHQSLYYCGGTAADPLMVLRERNGTQATLQFQNTNADVYTELRGWGGGGIRNRVNGTPSHWDVALWVGSKQWQPTEAGQAAGTIRAGKHACTTVTITGGVARKGDPVSVGFRADIGQGTNKDEGGLIWSGQVASDLGAGFNVVRVIAFNPTATDITGMTSDTLTVHARQGSTN